MEACVLLSKTMVLQTCTYFHTTQHMSPQIAWVLARVSNKHIVHEEGYHLHTTHRAHLSLCIVLILIAALHLIPRAAKVLPPLLLLRVPIRQREDVLRDVPAPSNQREELLA